MAPAHPVYCFGRPRSWRSALFFADMRVGVERFLLTDPLTVVAATAGIALRWCSTDTRCPHSLSAASTQMRPPESFLSPVPRGRPAANSLQFRHGCTRAGWLNATQSRATNDDATHRDMNASIEDNPAAADAAPWTLPPTGGSAC